MLRKTGLATALAMAYEVAELPQSSTPNYKMSATASAVLGTLWVIANMEGCSMVASKVAFIGALLSAGAAINQYGLQNTQLLITNTVNGFFYGKKEERKPVATAEEFHDAAPQEEMKKTL